jgi:branched-subunit amino acid aminotransferase/4-amino-4-deoxychorismate lyase
MKKISLEEAKDATEMMLIGSGWMIVPVVAWDDEPVGNGNSASPCPSPPPSMLM